VTDVHIESLELFDTNGVYITRVARAALPAELQIMDCGDPRYVMLVLQDHGYLVKKADLAIPAMPDACVKLAPGQRPPLGVPGAADIHYCP